MKKAPSYGSKYSQSYLLWPGVFTALKHFWDGVLPRPASCLARYERRTVSPKGEIPHLAPPRERASLRLNRPLDSSPDNPGDPFRKERPTTGRKEQVNFKGTRPVRPRWRGAQRLRSGIRLWSPVVARRNQPTTELAKWAIQRPVPICAHVNSRIATPNTVATWPSMSKASRWAASCLNRKWSQHVGSRCFISSIDNQIP